MTENKKDVLEEKEVEKNESVVEEKNEPWTSADDADFKKKIKKEKRKDDKKEIVELEREYIVPLRRGFVKVPRYRRAKKAIKILKEFVARHMKVEGRDLKKVKIDGYLNNEIWFRGIKKPMGKVKVRVKKIGDVVYVELAELPEVVKFAKAREEKRKMKVEKVKLKKVEEKVEEKSEEENIEESEDKKAAEERAAKVAKSEVKGMKHTASGKHLKKVMPVRKTLKK